MGRLLRVAEAFGTPIEVVTTPTQEPRRSLKTWVETGEKIKTVHQYLTNLTGRGGRDDIVMMIDAFDVIVTGPPEAILARYLATVRNTQSCVL